MKLADTIELIPSDRGGDNTTDAQPLYGSTSSSSHPQIEPLPATDYPSSSPRFLFRCAKKNMVLKAICAAMFIGTASYLLSTDETQQENIEPYYAPGNASWLGSSGTNPTPQDYAQYFPLIYVIFGLEGTPHVRVIVDESDDCPIPLHPELLDEENVLTTRTLGNPIDDKDMPYEFPVRVCELIAHKGTIHRQLLARGELSLSWKGQSYAVPRVKSNPSRYLLTGDTGLRLKPTNLGLGKLGDAPCNASEVYGIHQCFLNFTEDDLVENQTGSYQGLDEWVFKEIADKAAAMDVDVIVHVGDYLYRQGPCPLNNTDSLDEDTKNCSAVNSPEFATVGDITPSTIMNFIPGNYGDNWWGWWADFWYPAMNLLKTAPLIPTRGNHEICSRGGYGYFMFLSPVAIEDYCLDNFPVYNVPFENEQFLVMDDSVINPLYGGVDKYILGECPGIPSSGTIVPLQEDRFDDLTDNTVNQQVDMFTKQFKQVEKYTQTHATNFYVGHRPVLGIGCNASEVVTLDWTLQQSLGPTTLDRISGIITGHMHWLEVLQFQNDALPVQMVVGNGGTKMIKNYINQSSIPYLDFEVGKPKYNIGGRVKKGLTLSEFGFGVMERLDDGDYDVTFHTWREESQAVEPIDFSIHIPKGPRRGGGGGMRRDAENTSVKNESPNNLRAFG